MCQSGFQTSNARNKEILLRYLNISAKKIQMAIDATDIGRTANKVPMAKLIPIR